MFDDGRFEASVIAEAQSAGLQLSDRLVAPPADSGKPQEALQVKTVLRKLTSHAVTRSPKEEPLQHGWAGGGGVRLYPPHLDDSLAHLANYFQCSPRCQDGEDMSAAPTPTWNAKSPMLRDALM